MRINTFTTHKTFFIRINTYNKYHKKHKEKYIMTVCIP